MLSDIVSRFRESGEQAQLGQALNEYAACLEMKDQPEGALDALQEAEQLFRNLGDDQNLQTTIGYQGNVRGILGDSAGALTLYQQQEALCRKLGGGGVAARGLLSSLLNQGNVLVDQNDWAAAAAAFAEAERLSRARGDLDGLQRALSAQAAGSYHEGNIEEALRLLRESDSIARKIGLRSSLGQSLRLQALLLIAQDNLAAALDLCREAEELFRARYDYDARKPLVYIERMLLIFLRDYEGALAASEKLQRIETEMKARLIVYRKDLRLRLSRLALMAVEEAEVHCLELGLTKELNQVLIQLAFSRFIAVRSPLRYELSNQVLSALEEAERLGRDLGTVRKQTRLLLILGQVLEARKELEKSEAKWRAAVQLQTTAAEPDLLHSSLAGQAEVLTRLGRFAEADRLYERSVEVCHERGFDDSLKFTLNAWANSLVQADKVDEAEKVRNQEEELYRKLGELPELAKQLGIRAAAQGKDASLLLARQERITEEIDAASFEDLEDMTMALFFNSQEVERLSQSDDQEQLAQTYFERIKLLSRLGEAYARQPEALADGRRPAPEAEDLNEAMRWYTEMESLCVRFDLLEELQECLRGQFQVYNWQSDVRGRGQLQNEGLFLGQENTFREAGQIANQQRARLERAFCSAARGRTDTAAFILQEPEAYYRRVGDTEGLRRCLLLKSRIIHERADSRGEIAVLEEKIPLDHAAGDFKAEVESLWQIVGLLPEDEQGTQRELDLYKQTELAARGAGDTPSILFAMGRQPLLLLTLGDPNAAVQCLKEHEKLAREANSPTDLYRSLLMLGYLLLAWEKKPLEAVVKLTEGLSIAEENNGDEAAIQMGRESLAQAKEALPKT